MRESAHDLTEGLAPHDAEMQTTSKNHTLLTQESEDNCVVCAWGGAQNSLRVEIMRAEQVLSRSNLEVKVNYVSKCQQNPTIKTRHNFQISVSKPPIPGPVPGPLVCEYPGGVPHAKCDVGPSSSCVFSTGRCPPGGISPTVAPRAASRRRTVEKERRNASPCTLRL